MRKLIISLIVLILVLVALDRVAVAGVQRDLANRIAASADLSGTPTVTIEGVPFLTQALSGHYPEVRFDLGTLTYGGVPVRDLRGVAYDVTAPLGDILRNRPDVRAGRVTVSGTLTKQTLDRFAPDGIKIGSDGRRLTASGEVMVGANKLKIDATMRVEVTDGRIRLRAEKVEGVPDAVAQLMTFDLPFDGLPFDVRLTRVRSVPLGLEFTATATDVPIRG
ncbi:Protein of unknown function [Nonomuraea maritima]|uniref:DUF2993 domain-containing protein n=1 Tax=Nonomuraea maritima TaxID=683260 RepID=A0A1G9GLS3_9ACTN|nr:DUF2993 domain-containing protein [Nonomuraea maritima]SDL01648.1 Protein of unknown function [Nonomuraea maritima]